MRTAIVSLFVALVAFGSQVMAEQPHRSRVGVIVPLSGPLSEFGVAVQNGIRMAVLDSGGSAGTIEWIWEDSKSDANTAVSAFKKLADTPGTEMVFIWGTNPTEAVAPISQRRGVPLLAMSISPSVARNRNLVVRTFGDAHKMVKPLVDHLRKEHVQRIGLLKAELSYIDELTQALVDEMGPAVKIEVYPFDRGDNDFRSAITKIRNEKFDMVGVFLGAGQIRTFFRQAGALQLSSTFFGADLLGSEREIQESGPAINGSVFPDLSVCPSFLSNYKKQFGDDTHVAYAINAYDIAKLLIQKSTTTKQQGELFEALKDGGSNKGVCQDFVYADRPDVGKFFEYPVALYRVDKGKYFRVGDE